LNTVLITLQGTTKKLRRLRVRICLLSTWTLFTLRHFVIFWMVHCSLEESSLAVFGMTPMNMRPVLFSSKNLSKAFIHRKMAETKKTNKQPNNETIFTPIIYYKYTKYILCNTVCWDWVYTRIARSIDVMIVCVFFKFLLCVSLP